MNTRQRKASQNKSAGPIGVFDSGLGGLTVVKELRRQLPSEDILYFGDTARVPYGAKSRSTIIRFSMENSIFLLRHNVKLIIVACNTSSSVSLPILKKNFKVPVMGVIAPGALEAVSSTRNNRVGVIGTSATIRSNAYAKHIMKAKARIKVFARSCPLLVPLVEEGWLDNKVTRDIIRFYIMPLKSKKIDTLVLGCTHYPLLKNAFRKVAGRGIGLIDSAVSTARDVKALLEEEGALNNRKGKGGINFFVSDEPAYFRKVGEKFLGRKLLNVRKTDYGL